MKQDGHPLDRVADSKEYRGFLLQTFVEKVTVSNDVTFYSNHLRGVFLSQKAFLNAMQKRPFKRPLAYVQGMPELLFRQQLLDACRFSHVGVFRDALGCFDQMKRLQNTLKMHLNDGCIFKTLDYLLDFPETVPFLELCHQSNIWVVALEERLLLEAAKIPIFMKAFKKLLE